MDSEIMRGLQRPLTAAQIEFRVQSVSKKGFAVLLAYKDARVDMQRLDEVVGPLNWKREHTRDNRNCIVSIWDDGKSQWVSKEDTGTESNTESEKGLASDSFKRACFNWGIGRELYDFPSMIVKLNDDEWELPTGQQRPRTTWNFRLRDWDWYIEHDDAGRPSFIAGRDNNQKVRFKWGVRRGSA